jgi:hypothetical protein
MAEWLWPAAQRGRQHWIAGQEPAAPPTSAGAAAIHGWIAKLRPAAPTMVAAARLFGPLSEPSRETREASIRAFALANEKQSPAAFARAFRGSLETGNWTRAAHIAGEPAFDWFGLARHGADELPWAGFFPGVNPAPEDGSASPIQTLVARIFSEAIRQEAQIPTTVDKASASETVTALWSLAQRDALVQAAPSPQAEAAPARKAPRL